MSSSSAHNLTIPLNATVAFLTGTQIVIEQAGTAAVTIVATGGVTLQGATTTSAQYSTVCLIKQATDTWLSTSSNLSGVQRLLWKKRISGYSGLFGLFGLQRLLGLLGIQRNNVQYANAVWSGSYFKKPC